MADSSGLVWDTAEGVDVAGCWTLDEDDDGVLVDLGSADFCLTSAGVVSAGGGVLAQAQMHTDTAIARIAKRKGLMLQNLKKLSFIKPPLVEIYYWNSSFVTAIPEFFMERQGRDFK